MLDLAVSGSIASGLLQPFENAREMWTKWYKLEHLFMILNMGKKTRVSNIVIDTKEIVHVWTNHKQWHKMPCKGNVAHPGHSCRENAYKKNACEPATVVPAMIPTDK